MSSLRYDSNDISVMKFCVFITQLAAFIAYCYCLVVGLKDDIFIGLIEAVKTQHIVSTSADVSTGIAITSLLLFANGLSFRCIELALAMVLVAIPRIILTIVHNISSESTHFRVALCLWYFSSMYCVFPCSSLVLMTILRLDPEQEIWNMRNVVLMIFVSCIGVTVSMLGRRAGTTDAQNQLIDVIAIIMYLIYSLFLVYGFVRWAYSSDMNVSTPSRRSKLSNELRTRMNRVRSMMSTLLIAVIPPPLAAFALKCYFMQLGHEVSTYSVVLQNLCSVVILGPILSCAAFPQQSSKKFKLITLWNENLTSTNEVLESFGGDRSYGQIMAPHSDGHSPEPSLSMNDLQPANGDQDELKLIIDNEMSICPDERKSEDGSLPLQALAAKLAFRGPFPFSSRCGDGANMDEKDVEDESELQSDSCGRSINPSRFWRSDTSSNRNNYCGPRNYTPESDKHCFDVMASMPWRSYGSYIGAKRFVIFDLADA